jgi:predicted GNAT family acetyltransferase
MDDEIAVSDVPDRSRYEARIDGKLAGFAEYVQQDGRIVILHTETEPGFEGKGVGGKLTVVPMCPFIAGYIDRHDDYADLVAK